MKTAASLLSQVQLLVSPTSAFPSKRRVTQLLVLTMTEMSIAPAFRFQEHRHAGRAPVEAGGLSWSCWAVELCWQPSDWDATC